MDEVCACGKSPDKFAGGYHGFLVHRGKCQVARKRKADAPPELEPELPPIGGNESDKSDQCSSSEDEPSNEDKEEDAPQSMDVDVPADKSFATHGDVALAQLYLKYPGLSHGVIDDMLRVMLKGPATIKSTKKLLEFVDELPGVFLLKFAVDSSFSRTKPNL